ncbi:hypothetical protein [Rhizobium sp. SL42]|uniref:hypothetical protein n=1 Tax=Rhizobium sp. SL42 TaxID=2806346 RepID=UPI001F21E019|nr:hypothetical protein [Rhizobium sp. SL42]UJW74173.1 hypothetical protein IM739_14985 [Rhizobium sp. SL42]
MIRHRFYLSTLLASFCVLAAGTASAESYSGLLKKGYTVAAMSHAKSGSMGWVLSGKDGKHFCKAKFGMAVIDSKTLVSFLPSGKMIKLDRVVFEESVGGPDPSLPNLADLKAGRVEPRHVGSCVPLRG